MRSAVWLTVKESRASFAIEFNDYEEALAAWRYPDLTEHTEYLAHIVEVTIEQEMCKEAGYLRSLHAARARLKEIIEGLDADIDRIIRSIRENGGQLSNKLKNTYPNSPIQILVVKSLPRLLLL